MARRKNYFNFNDFNYVDGAFDLFQNTLRGAFEYDALTDDTFQARVLTEPTPIVESAGELGGRLASEGLNQKYSFRVRILGDHSPHKFLEDPCLLEDASSDASANKVFSIIQNHTQVILYDEGTERKPKTGDIVNIKLGRSGNSYNLKRAKQYIGIANDVDGAAVKATPRADCANLAALFVGENFNELSTYSTGEEGATIRYPDIDSPEVQEVYKYWLTQVEPKDVEKLEKCGGIGGYTLVDCKTAPIGNRKDIRLHPEFWNEAKAAYDLMKAHAASVGERFSAGSTKRTPKEQIRLRIGNRMPRDRVMSKQDILQSRERGAFKPLTATVPLSLGGGSNHLYGLAIDFPGVLQQDGLEKAQEPNSKAKQSSTYRFWRDGGYDKEGFKMMSQKAGDGLEPWHFSWDGK